MMAEYYNKEAVIEFIRSYRHSTDVAFHMEEHLYEIPAADVVEVVRCKDCIQHVPDTCFCRMADWTTRDEDFCSLAIKRRKADG